MKNPCNECLVVAACTEPCNPKLSYGTQLHTGVRNYGSFLASDSNPRFRQRTKAILKYYNDKNMANTEDLIKINRRKNGQL